MHLMILFVAGLLMLSPSTSASAKPSIDKHVSSKQTDIRETSMELEKGKNSISSRDLGETIPPEPAEASPNLTEQKQTEAELGSYQAPAERKTDRSIKNPSNEDKDQDREVATSAEDSSSLQTNESLDHYDLSKSYLSHWDCEMAEVELEAAIMCLPTLKIAHRDYAIVSLLRGHPLRALAEVMMVLGLGDPIPLTDEEKAALKLKAAKLHYRKALAHGKKDEWKNAISELKWAMEYSQQNAAIQRSLAFAYASAGDLDKAEKEYLKSFDTDSTDGFAHADFAFILSDQGKDERAMGELAQAVELEPKAAALHVDLGWLAERKGDFETAKSEIDQAIKLSPGHAGLWAHLGRILERQGKREQAQHAYLEAIAINPQQDEAKRRLDYIKTHDNSENSKQSVPQEEAHNADRRRVDGSNSFETRP